MFNEANPKFQWHALGDIELGRPNMGATTSVAVYRLMQFTLRTALVQELGPEKAAQMFVKAGAIAGAEFCLNSLDTSLDFNEFMACLQAKMKALGIGVLRVEESDLAKMAFTFTVSEDLDCSGLPAIDETVCDYDEGFIAGILNTYTGKVFDVKEIDCWASGGRVCRFCAKLKEDSAT